jgi:hypothetical protein
MYLKKSGEVIRGVIPLIGLLIFFLNTVGNFPYSGQVFLTKVSRVQGKKWLRNGKLRGANPNDFPNFESYTEAE